MGRRSAARNVLISVITALLFSLALGPVAPAVADSVPSTDPVAAEAAGRDLTAAADALGALGIYYDQTEAEWVVVFARGAAAPRSRVEAGGLTARISVLNSTRDELAAVATALNSLVDRLRPGEAFAYSVDLATGVTEVGGTAPAHIFADTLEDLPGRVRYQVAAEGGRLSRDADPAPHNGGASMFGPAQGGTGLCTSGFTVHKTSDNRNYLVTAGHCWGTGADIVGADGASFGEVDWRAVFPTYDLELVGDSTYDGWIYRGDAIGAQKRVVNAADPIANSTYCSSGTVSLEHCNHTVNSTSSTFCDDLGCTPNLMRFTNGNLLAEGDSGGPVYFPNANDTLAVRGTIVGKIGTNGYAHKWTTIRDRFGVTIVFG